MMVLCQPQRKDVELVIAWKHGVEGGEIAKRLLHHLRPRIDEDPMHRGNNVAELLRASRREQEAKRELALGLLVERPDNFAEVVYVIVCGLRSRAGFQRGGIPPAHHARQNPDFEERDELLLGVDLAAGRARGLHPPRRAEDTIAVERKQSGKQARARRLWGSLQREHLDVPLSDLHMVAMPRDRTLHDLAVNTAIAAKLPSGRPLLKIEKVAEELEGLELAE